MSSDFEWNLEVMDSCFLHAQDLNREIFVEWVVERAESDLGCVAVKYTRSADLDRPFASDTVLATVWEGDDKEGFQCLLQKDFLHIGLAKRWCTAQSEVFMVCDANEWLEHQKQGFEWEEDDFE